MLVTRPILTTSKELLVLVDLWVSTERKAVPVKMGHLVGMVPMAKTVNVGTMEPLDQLDQLDHPDQSVLRVPPVLEVLLEKTEKTEHQVTSLDHLVHQEFQDSLEQMAGTARTEDPEPWVNKVPSECLVPSGKLVMEELLDMTVNLENLVLKVSVDPLVLLVLSVLLAHAVKWDLPVFLV